MKTEISPLTLVLSDFEAAAICETLARLHRSISTASTRRKLENAADYLLNHARQEARRFDAKH